MQQSVPVICLFGPTAVGKSSVAIELANRLPCEIISVDSAMIYKDMDIGTAKPDKATLAKVPHALIDFLDPSIAYSVGQFTKDAKAAIDQIHQKNKIPLLVGGTMLYFRMLQQGIADIPTIEPAIRNTLKQRGLQEGWPVLYKELMEIDAASATRIHENDAQRIQRALEVYYQTGKSLSDWHRLQTHHQPYHFVNISLMPKTRAMLAARIETRLQEMLNLGLISEVAKLLHRGDLHPSMNALRSVGYAQVWQYLTGKIDYATMFESILSATRQLAKQQMTWIRSWPAVHEVDFAVDASQQVVCLIEKKFDL